MATTYPVRPLSTPAPARKRPVAAPKPTQTASPKPQLSTRQGQGGNGVAVVKSIVANDLQTHGHLAKALYYRALVGKSGKVNTTNSAQLDKLLARFTERQQRLQSSRLLKVTTAVNQTVQGWVSKWRALISGPGVGAIPLIVPVAVVAVVGLATACWLAFHQDEPKSAADVAESFHLSQAYAQMSDEEKGAADKALQDAAKGAYAEGKKDGSTGFLATIKDNILLIGGGILLYNYATRKKGG